MTQRYFRVERFYSLSAARLMFLLRRAALRLAHNVA